MLKQIRTVGRWIRLIFVSGLLLFLVYAIVDVNQQMDEHGFWQVYGEPYYGN